MQNIVLDKKWGNFPNFGSEWGIFPTLQDGQELGRVGRRCRNKWYVEVEVAGVWAKAELGDWVVHPHDWVVVELAWVSADGRDREWRIVAKMQPAAPKPDPVPVVAQLDAPEEEAPTPAELEHPGAEDFMERARREAYAAFSQ